MRMCRNDLKILEKERDAGDLQSYEWTSRDRLDYVNNLFLRSHINFSELAREFGLKDIGDYQSDKKINFLRNFCRKIMSIWISSFHIVTNKLSTMYAEKGGNRLLIPMSLFPCY